MTLNGSAVFTSRHLRAELAKHAPQANTYWDQRNTATALASTASSLNDPATRTVFGSQVPRPVILLLMIDRRMQRGSPIPRQTRKASSARVRCFLSHAAHRACATSAYPSSTEANGARASCLYCARRSSDARKVGLARWVSGVILGCFSATEKPWCTGKCKLEVDSRNRGADGAAGKNLPSGTSNEDAIPCLPHLTRHSAREAP
jgi:hypothetical protein